MKAGVPEKPVEVNKRERYGGVWSLFPPVILVVSLILMFWSGMWGLADMFAMKPGRLMSAWETAGAVGGDENEWKGAVEDMETAINLNPCNADYTADMGRLYEWIALAKPVWTEHAHKNRAKAITFYRRALAVGPARGFVWAHLAQTKALNQELDGETFDAMEKAMTLGKRAPGTRSKVIWVGLSAWDSLPVTLKERLRETVQLALLYGPAQFVIETAVIFGWEDNLSPMLEKEWQKKSLMWALKEREKEAGQG